MKYPYSNEIYFAQEIIESHYGRDSSLLPAVFRLRTVDANPEAQVPVILTEDNLLIVALGYQIPESAASLESKGFYQSIPQFEEPLYVLGKIAEHRLKDAVRR